MSGVVVDAFLVSASPMQLPRSVERAPPVLQPAGPQGDRYFTRHRYLVVVFAAGSVALKRQVLRTRGPTGLDEATLSRAVPHCK